MENICNIISDLNRGMVVSPKRIKYLIKVKETMLAGFRIFEKKDGRVGVDARASVGRLKREIEGYKAMLADATGTAERIERAMLDCALAESARREALTRLYREWRAEAEGLAWCARSVLPGAVSLEGCAKEA